MTSALSRSGRTGRIATPAAAVMAVAGAAALAVTLAPTQASATTGHAPRGRIASAWQSSIDHKVHVSGFAFDAGSGQSRRPVKVAVYVNGRFRRMVEADRPSGRFDRTRHIHGRHAFSVVMNVHRKATNVRLHVHAAGRGNGDAWADRSGVRHLSPKTQRIVRVAKRYVGSRYSYGADGPHAFDCSGYSKFVYSKAHIAKLPHNSQAQRHAKHMHRISRSQARPGDLVFYLSGGRAYHVAIYAGHDMQYSATDPQQGVEHDKISSRHVIFKTDWH